MPFVVTADQQHSRRSPDRVAGAIAWLAHTPARLPFERTVGDELQGLLTSADAAADVVLRLVRDGGWHIGIGAGPVAQPLGATSRASSGPAFFHARDAVEAAKRRPQHVAVRGARELAAADAEAVLTLLAVIVQRRTAAAWEAIDLDRDGLTHAEVAQRLGITRQAVGQRLATGLWHQELQARPALVRLLEQADER